MSVASEGNRLGWRKLRRFTRMRVPEAVLWVLGFWWLWGIVDGYNRPRDHGQVFNPAVQEAQLLAWDRLHRLNAVLENRPAWEQWLLSYQDPAVLGRHAYDSLEDLAEQNQLDARGLSAMALLSQQWQFTKDMPNGTLEPLIAETLSPSKMNLQHWREWEQRLGSENALWWDVAQGEKIAHANEIYDLDDEIAAQRQKNESLYHRTMLANCGAYGLFLAGLCLVPKGLRGLRCSLQILRTSSVVRYPARISLTLLGTLLIGAEMLNNFWVTGATTLGMPWTGQWWWEMSIDTVWRLLPATAILWILYRKPAWVARSFELLRRPQWSIILALYALLLIADFVLFGIMQQFEELDPTEHLNAMEKGWMGLVYGLISACLMAPLTEEFIYRGFLFRGLLHKCGFAIAAGLSSIIFAVSHFYDIYGTISVGLFGAASALLYLATRSLTNAILLHMLYNLTITVPMWMLFHSPT